MAEHRHHDEQHDAEQRDREVEHLRDDVDGHPHDRRREAKRQKAAVGQRVADERHGAVGAHDAVEAHQPHHGFPDEALLVPPLREHQAHPANPRQGQADARDPARQLGREELGDEQHEAGQHDQPEAAVEQGCPVALAPPAAVDLHRHAPELVGDAQEEGDAEGQEGLLERVRDLQAIDDATDEVALAHVAAQQVGGPRARCHPDQEGGRGTPGQELEEAADARVAAIPADEVPGHAHQDDAVDGVAEADAEEEDEAEHEERGGVELVVAWEAEHLDEELGGADDGVVGERDGDVVVGVQLLGHHRGLRELPGGGGLEAVEVAFADEAGQCGSAACGGHLSQGACRLELLFPVAEHELDLVTELAQLGQLGDGGLCGLGALLALGLDGLDIGVEGGGCIGRGHGLEAEVAETLRREVAVPGEAHAGQEGLAVDGAQLLDGCVLGAEMAIEHAACLLLGGEPQAGAGPAQRIGGGHGHLDAAEGPE